MMFASLFILIPALILFPWWVIVVLGFAAGWISGPRLRYAVSFAFATGVVWSAIAFVKDGRHAGAISQRMAGLFGLPSSGLIFAVVFAVGFLTAFLSFQAASSLSVVYKPKTISGKSRASE